MASRYEANFSMIGFLAALLSSVTTAAQSIASGRLLTGSDRLSSFNLMYYLSPLAFLIILPAAAVSEWGPILNSWDPPSGRLVALMLLVISGIISVLLSCVDIILFLVPRFKRNDHVLVTHSPNQPTTNQTNNRTNKQTNKQICLPSVWAISHTSSLTFNVAGNFKAVINIVVSVLIFRNQITLWNGVGCSITIAGVALYSYLQHLEQSAAHVSLGAPLVSALPATAAKSHGLASEP